jgi:isocitrate dehydrogenase
LKTLEDGIHTYDLYDEASSKEKVGTQGFADAVIERLGQVPSQLPAVSYANSKKAVLYDYKPEARAEKELVGVDIFLDWNEEGRNSQKLGDALSQHSSGPLSLQLITHRGVKVYPAGLEETFCTDHWRCRYTTPKMDQKADYADVIAVCKSLSEAGFDIIKTENLCRFDGELGFSLGQGQ